MERVSCGFSILLSAANGIKFFGTFLCIYHIASFTKKNLCNRLIYYSTSPRPGDDSLLPQSLLHHHFTDIPPTQDVNSSTNKSPAPVAIHFGPYLTCLPQ